MQINDYKIQKHTKIINSNASIYQKIFIYKDRGILYLKKNLFTKAIDDFTQNIELSKEVNNKKRVNLFTNRELGVAYFYRGYAYAKTNYLKLAIEDFDKAAKLYPLSFNRNMINKLEGEIKDILKTKLSLLKLFFLE
tara:strand:- start:327 stop:737 length:411 start_codon:yes stop_codon:yes gene_type:complete